MTSKAQFEEMLAMMNREREKENKKLFYAEDQKDQKRTKNTRRQKLPLRTSEDFSSIPTSARRMPHPWHQ
ncbi:hypothetical protein E3P89_00980 [Wallemia ichthyophaga]|uniref:Uncharacterized protein n=1 Tax=Wallemia ichthyophaga TaxID=245174 RepID=A0A4T0HJS1_WALIC|nr:hypothetical protein E3P90_01275 [Wallemia ichthyophaga]TIB16238.1 hypothetical protein E3P93_01026 [Wallemia ichthyophaga]TIB24444.1 hypothetical protein E3P89_00980 [Wallemia ichthyophaga]TIB26215.1 hypothetical protein E3P88_01144 [Wallemia ichthyophaga]